MGWTAITLTPQTPTNITNPVVEWTSITLTPITLANVTDSVDNLHDALASYTAVLSGISSSLSIAGAIVIFITYYMLPEVRTHTRKLFIYLTVADFMTAVGYLAGVIHFLHGDGPDAACIIQGAFTVYSNMASIIWIVTIKVHILLASVYKTSFATSKRRMIVCHCFCWGIPGLLIIIGLGNKALGQIHHDMLLPWCFIDDRHHFTVWVFVLCVAWEMVAYLLTAVLYIYLKFYEHCLHPPTYTAIPNDSEHVILPENDAKFRLLWMILYLLKLWGTVRVFIQVVGSNAISNTSNKVLISFQCLFGSAQAFCTCVVFCVFDRAIRSGVKTKLCPRNE